MTFLGQVINQLFSTGKRRYGHPALNGVLPEPWLPLKKGQTLVNSDRNGSHNQNTRSQGDQAVVLTLRKRYSMARSRRDSRAGESNVASPSDINAPPGEGGDAVPVDPSTIINPWQDATARSAPRRNQTLTHRLSYDHASGVIMLPEDGGWLEEDDDDADSDEVDYGTEHGGLEQSVTESITSDNGPTGPSGATSNAGAGQLPPRVSRYGTYFHHPERRRQTIPGSFPVR